METVKIKNYDMSWHIAADVRFPPRFDKSKQYPAIVSVHPIGSCKEQTSGNVYGEAMAKEGFVVIAFDASFQGASGGEPRFIENPVQRVTDIRHVIDYLMTLPYVDENRVGVIGVCGGGAYWLSATKTDRCIKATVSITGFNFGRLMRDGFSAYKPLESTICCRPIPRRRSDAARPSATSSRLRNTTAPRAEKSRMGRRVCFPTPASLWTGTPSASRRPSSRSLSWSSLATRLVPLAPIGMAWRFMAVPSRRTKSFLWSKARRTTTSTISPSPQNRRSLEQFRSSRTIWASRLRPHAQKAPRPLERPLYEPRSR
jgi:dienelactone hydrolase